MTLCRAQQLILTSGMLRANLRLDLVREKRSGTNDSSFRCDCQLEQVMPCEGSFTRGITIMRKYSRVRIARNRVATAESQEISSERQRSIADLKSRRNATQEGHASI